VPAHRYPAAGYAPRALYPSIFRGRGSLTELLVRIARYEPLLLGDLPSEFEASGNVTWKGCKLLQAVGIAAPYDRRLGGRGLPRHSWWLDRRHPAYAEIRTLLAAISRGTGRPVPPIAQCEPDGKPAQPRQGDGLELLFGLPNRTLAIMLVGQSDYLDASTIARTVGIPTTWRSLSLLAPIVRDGIFDTEAFGRLTLYALRDDHGWSRDLRKLIARVAEIHPRFRVLASAAHSLMLTGGGSARGTLRRRVARERNRND